MSSTTSESGVPRGENAEDAVRSEWWHEAVRFVGCERDGGLSDEGFLTLLLHRVPEGAVRTRDGWSTVEAASVGRSS